MRALALSLGLLVALSQTACVFSARPDQFRYYTLAAAIEARERSASDLTVGLGPVTLPGYLSRPGLVTRVDDTQVRYAEDERWAEPLGKQFPRTLNEDLSRALGGVQVIDYPWNPGTPIDLAVRVTVHSFEVDAKGIAALTAAWSLRDPQSRKVVYEGKSVIVEPVGTPGGDAAAAALSRTLAQLSRELAVAIVAHASRRS